MMNSLQAQLLKAGLVDEKKIKQAQRSKKKTAKQQPDTLQAVAEAAERVRQEKLERDRQLNQQRQEEAARREAEAQVKQMIEQHRIDRSQGDTAYQFVSKKKIKKIHVTGEQFERLSRGTLAIARLGPGFELIPADIATRISERAPHWPVIVAEVSAQPADEDDPYADYKIPDDLMW
ncbi:DUF2058 domain-containing protein [Halopseudomonas yangmingensis]|uniref:Nucleoprotein/polynucleotide-associated enzyme n=1 Tax=Halopseudomonas yangmingensis TaxID=1720063 RepID=A0A1I4QBF9_9GAMM|nr:DUF2058 domain-containing protein [Halopseudomonas yangmingensis]SFM37387.1 hypothetical protein SAMN05216217_10470 [Halopseudomonas yangmingensis]